MYIPPGPVVVYDPSRSPHVCSLLASGIGSEMSTSLKCVWSELILELLLEVPERSPLFLLPWCS